MCYFAYSDFLKQKYGEKVYKAPIHLNLTCPNRDRILGTGGCIFCPEIGAGDPALPAGREIKDQLRINMDYIGKRYNAKKFIAYFQNYTNTYLENDRLEEMLSFALLENIVEISLSTRPDSVTREQLSLLWEFKEAHGIEITLELGLQSINLRTLQKINRGHSLAEFIDAAQNAREFNIPFSAHVILNLPWDEMDDIVECAKILSVLGCETVKPHSLYILRKTAIAAMYEAGAFTLLSQQEYFERLGAFLSYLDPKIAVQRLFARAPFEDALFVTWNKSWRRLKEEFINYMKKNNLSQGANFSYRDGAAWHKRFG